MVDEAAKTGAIARARERAGVARAAVRSADAARRDDPARAHRRPADERRTEQHPPLPARGAPVAHPGLRRVAGQHRRLRQREGHACRWPGRAGRSCWPICSGPFSFFPRPCRPSRCCGSCSASGSASPIAVDEHGGVGGMVTFEDLVEELVGDIFSEHEERRAALDARARRRGHRARRHADSRRQPRARIELDGAAGRRPPWRASAPRWRAGSPTATRVWRPGDGSVLVVLEASAAGRQARARHPARNQ